MKTTGPHVSDNSEIPIFQNPKVETNLESKTKVLQINFTITLDSIYVLKLKSLLASLCLCVLQFT